MIFTGEFDSKWEEGEERVSKLVFIGKNLDHDALKKGFAACAYSEERATQKLQNLRFQVADKVECKFGGGWRRGTIVRRMFKANMPGGLGTVAPYVLLLGSGNLSRVGINTVCEQEILFSSATRVHAPTWACSACGEANT